MNTLQNIEVSKLVPSGTNPRKYFDKAYLNELAESIREKGVIQPLIVRKNGKEGIFQIVAGECRFKAAQIAEANDVPCIIRELTDEQALEIQVIENDQRRDVHPLEQADGYARLIKTTSNSTAEIIAAKLGKSVTYVVTRLKLLDMSEPAKKLFLAGDMTISHAILIARLPANYQKDALQWAKRGDSVASMKEQIARNFMLELSAAAFDTKDSTLVPSAGACVECPKRTGANRLLFSDIRQKDICTDPLCFQSKEQAFVHIQMTANPDAQPLTVASYLPHEVKLMGKTEWRRVDPKAKCEHLAQGIVVQVLQQHHDRYAKLGMVFAICTNYEKCKVHNPHASSANRISKLTPAEKRKREEAVILTEAQGLALTQICQSVDSIGPKEVDIIASSVFERLWHDYKRKLFGLHGWEAAKHKDYGGRDWDGTFRKKYEELKAVDRLRILMEMALLQAVPSPFAANAGKSGFDAALGIYKINLKNAVATVRKKRAEAAKTKLKSKGNARATGHSN